MANAQFHGLCHLTGRDTSDIEIAGSKWWPHDYENRYLYDGMFATIRCPTPIRHITLAEQVRQARNGWTFDYIMRIWSTTETPAR